MVGFPLNSYHKQYFFGVMRNKLKWTTASETSNTISGVNQKKIKSSRKEYVM